MPKSAGVSMREVTTNTARLPSVGTMMLIADQNVPRSARRERGGGASARSGIAMLATLYPKGLVDVCPI